MDQKSSQYEVALGQDRQCVISLDQKCSQYEI